MTSFWLQYFYDNRLLSRCYYSLKSFSSKQSYHRCNTARVSVAERTNGREDGDCPAEESLSASDMPPAADVISRPTVIDGNKMAPLANDVTRRILSRGRRAVSLSDERKTAIVDLHNKLRRQEGASNMEPLVRTHMCFVSLPAGIDGKLICSMCLL